VMTAHIVYPALDDTHPATLSRAILGFGEPATFGFGLAWGLMRRPRR